MTKWCTMFKVNFLRILMVSIVCISFVFFSCGSSKKITKRESTAAITQVYANILAVPAKDLDSKLYTFIHDWMRVPHSLGGMDKSGVDCSGFVTLLYDEVYQQTLPRTSQEMGDRVKRKYEKELKEGDLVFFSFGGKNIDHVGVYLHNGKFVHVSTKAGVVISNLRDAWYYRYFTRCGVIKK